MWLTEWDCPLISFLYCCFFLVYKNKVNIFILFSMTLVNLIIISCNSFSFFCKFLRIFNTDNRVNLWISPVLLLPLQSHAFYFYLFIFLSLLHWLKPPVHCWTEVVKIDLLILSLIVRKKAFSLSLLSVC